MDSMEVQRAILYYNILLYYFILYNTIFIVPQLKSMWPCGFQTSESGDFTKLTQHIYCMLHIKSAKAGAILCNQTH